MSKCCLPVIARRENRVVTNNDISGAGEAGGIWLERFHITAAIDAKVQLPRGEVENVSLHYHAPKQKKFGPLDEAFLER